RTGREIQTQLFIELVPANSGQIITARLKEESFKKRPGTVHCRRLTRSQSFIDLDQGFFLVLGAIPFQGALDRLMVVIALHKLDIVAKTNRLEENGDWDLSGAVDPNIKDVVGIELHLQPGPAVGDDTG